MLSVLFLIVVWIFKIAMWADGRKKVNLNGFLYGLCLYYTLTGKRVHFCVCERVPLYSYMRSRTLAFTD